VETSPILGDVWQNSVFEKLNFAPKMATSGHFGKTWLKLARGHSLRVLTGTVELFCFILDLRYLRRSRQNSSTLTISAAFRAAEISQNRPHAVGFESMHSSGKCAFPA